MLSTVCGRCGAPIRSEVNTRTCRRTCTNASYVDALSGGCGACAGCARSVARMSIAGGPLRLKARTTAGGSRAARDAPIAWGPGPRGAEGVSCTSKYDARHGIDSRSPVEEHEHHIMINPGQHCFAGCFREQCREGGGVAALSQRRQQANSQPSVIDRQVLCRADPGQPDRSVKAHQSVWLPSEAALATMLGVHTMSSLSVDVNWRPTFGPHCVLHCIHGVAQRMTRT